MIEIGLSVLSFFIISLSFGINFNNEMLKVSGRISFSSFNISTKSTPKNGKKSLNNVFY